ncbi:hypothetical protein QE152_g26181 [Popillia japonica]|uniref:Uncharacterized protein n=1 Tax=Popillia japonica TaxID=7064 RepID=A0AAW1JZ92_POPJA
MALVADQYRKDHVAGAESDCESSDDVKHYESITRATLAPCLASFGHKEMSETCSKFRIIWYSSRTLPSPTS